MVVFDSGWIRAWFRDWGEVVSFPLKLAASVCIFLAAGLRPAPVAAGWVFGDDPLSLAAERDRWRDQAASCWRDYGLLLGKLAAANTKPADRVAFEEYVKKRVAALDEREAALALWQKKLGEIARRVERLAGRCRPASTVGRRPERPAARPVTPGTSAGSPVRAALGHGPCDVVFILDASGSMRRFLKFPRIRRFDMARYKVLELARGLPPGSRIALRVFGSRTGNRQADRARGCRDSILVRPLGRVDESGLLRLLLRTRPSGWTCIGWSLIRAVSDDLKNSRSKCKAIVVISDGDDQCEFLHGRVRDIEARVRAQGVTVFQVRIGPAGAVPR